MATWPTTAIILFEGFQAEREPATMRSRMETGIKQARIKTKVLVARSFRVLFRSYANYTSFIAWVASDIAGGSAWFDWVDPADGATKSARIVGGKLGPEKPQRKAMDRWELPLSIETWSA